MIKKEFYKTREDGVKLYRTYSDANLKIRKVGTDEVYDEAVDVDGAPYTYEETGTPIEVEATEEEKNTFEEAMRAEEEAKRMEEEMNNLNE